MGGQPVLRADEMLSLATVLAALLGLMARESSLSRLLLIWLGSLRRRRGGCAPQSGLGKPGLPRETPLDCSGATMVAAIMRR